MFLRRRDFFEKTLNQLAALMEKNARAEESGVGNGFLQRLDPRVKCVGFLGLIFAAAASRSETVSAVLLFLGVILVIASGTRVVGRMAGLWGGVLLFTGTVVLPATFLTPGQALFSLPLVGWTITNHGIHSAFMLIARAETTATFAALLALTTPWARLLKALRILRVPVLFVVILGMTYRFIFVLLGISRNFFEARRARRVGRLDARQRRSMAVSSAAMLLSKSVQLSGEVYEAMQARGFRGEVRILEDFRMKRMDWCMLAAFTIVALVAFGIGSLP
jgi:cobalt ECF transporter T component CbiQ